MVALGRGGGSCERGTPVAGVHGVEAATRLSGRATSPPPPSPLTPNTVELIPNLGVLPPRGRPVQEPILTPFPDRAEVTGTVPE